MIVVAGEALIDLIVGPDGGLTASPGGGPYNTARTIARLGQPVTFLGRISRDRFGRELRANLVGAGVAADGMIPTDDPSTLAVAEIDEHGVAVYHFYVEGTSAAGLTAAEAAPVGAAAGTALHVGTLGLVLEPIGTTIERLVEASEPERLVMLDPNCRPSATPDRAAFRARIERIARRADVVKVSEDDLRFLAGDDAPDAPDAVIERLLELGVRVVLRTHGSNDVEIRTRSGRATIPVQDVDVVDTVGAGDAFGGGFLASWIGAGHGRGDLASMDRLCESVQVAVRVAALSCSRSGADPPTLAELEAFPG